MEFRKLGNTGIDVSLLGFGAGHIGSLEMNESQASNLLNTVLDLGINLIDTARSYGESENRIGRHLAHRRHDFILSTKVGYSYKNHPDWSYEATLGTIEESLARLRTDCIDIVHLHSCEQWVLERGDAILATERAREQGKVRIVAYSGENEALDFAIASGRFGSIQCSVNIFDQQGIGRYLPSARAKGMGIIAKRPLGNAVWRYNSRPDGHGHAAYWDRMKQLETGLPGLDWDKIALRFTAYAPEVSTIITGTSSPEHLKENIRFLKNGRLPEELIRHIRECFIEKGADWKGLI